MELEYTNSGPTAKLPILKFGEYKMWAIRIKQYFQIQDYALWKVIENGDSWVPISQTTEENGITTLKMSTPATVEEKIKKKNDVKDRVIVLHAFPIGIFTKHSINIQMLNLCLLPLKQDLEKIVSRLAILGVIIAQEDLNLKFISSLPPEWNTHVVVWMNKPEIETMSIDDLYNNFKIVKQKIKKTVGTSSGGQNLAFLIAPSSNSINNANTAYSQVSAASPSVNIVSLRANHDDDLESTGSEVATLFAKCESKEVLSEDRQEDFSLMVMILLDMINLRWSVTTFISWDTLPGSAEHQEARKISLEIKTTPGSKETKETLPRQCLAIDGVWKNEVLFSEEVAVLKREVGIKQYEINTLKAEPNKLDLSYSGLDEFKEPEFKGYGLENNKKESNVVKESDNSKENSDKSLVKEQESQVKSSFVEDDEEQDESMTKPVKKTIIHTAAKIEKPFRKSVRVMGQDNTPVNTVRPRVVNTARSIETSVNAARENGFNAVKPSACWVWRPIKPNSVSITLNRYNYIDARGISKSVMAWFDGGYVAFGGGAYGGKISGKENYYSQANVNAVQRSWAPKLQLFSNSYQLRHCLRGGSLFLQPTSMDERMCYIIRWWIRLFHKELRWLDGKGLPLLTSSLRGKKKDSGELQIRPIHGNTN
ncbi:hypothetical protein Tco_1406024 [Tanacetum coccineum]